MAIGRNTAVLLNQASAAQTTNGNSIDLVCDQYDQLAFDFNVTAFTGGTSPTVQFLIERKGADGTYYPIYTSAAIAAIGLTSVSIGPGLPNNAAIGNFVRMRWVFTGAPTSVTFSASILAK